MELKKELDQWIKEDTKFITRFYHIMNHAQERTIELYYKYEKDDHVIEKKSEIEVGINYQLSKEELDGVLTTYNNKFHQRIAVYIEQKWEQEIFTYNPDHRDIFDIAYYAPLTERIEDEVIPVGILTIADGRRRGEKIIAKDEEINDLEKKGELEIIGWCHR